MSARGVVEDVADGRERLRVDERHHRQLCRGAALVVASLMKITTRKISSHNKSLGGSYLVASCADAQG